MNGCVRLKLALRGLLASMLVASCALAEPNHGIGLRAAHAAADWLGPGRPSVTRPLLLDPNGRVRLHVLAPHTSLTITVFDPDADPIDETTVASFGGEYFECEGGSWMVPAPVTTSPDVYHYVMDFNATLAGSYTLVIDAGTAPVDPVPLLFQLSWDSPIGAAFMTTGEAMTIEQPAVLAALLFEGATPIPGATVSAEVLRPDGQVDTVVLLDDGQNADANAGDGVYSGLYVAPSAGEFIARASMTGTSPGGVAFSRQGLTNWRVFAGAAAIAGPLTGDCVDDDGDGRYDRYEVRAPVTISQAGNYFLGVLLESGGKTVHAAGFSDLTAGQRIAKAEVPAVELQAAATFGPFEVRDVRFEVRDDGSYRPAGPLANIEQTLPGCAWETWAREPIEILYCGFMPEDAPPQTGKYNFLHLDLLVRVVLTGEYEFAGELVDSEFRLVQRVIRRYGLYAHQVFPVRITFSGASIARMCAVGPYEAGTFTIHRRHGGPSAYVHTLCASDAFTPLQFDAEAPLDCDGNGVPDCIDIENDPNLDCNHNGVHDRCDRDCDHNQVPDDCETFADCNLNRIPDVCEPGGDCNHDGVPDLCQGFDDCDEDGIPDICQAYKDGNHNGIPDICEHDNDCNYNHIPDELEELADCNNDGHPDICEIRDGILEDCNFNGIPDECEICCDLAADLNLNGILDVCEYCPGGSGAPCDFRDVVCLMWICDGETVPAYCGLWHYGFDCDQNGVPDCLQFDCNHNGVPDACDIADGTLHDVNCNHWPDECECLGDLNGDRRVDQDDLDILLFAWQTHAAGDLDCDNDTDQDDLDILIFNMGCVDG